MSYYEEEIKKILADTYINVGFFKNKNALITGATGLIGQYFVDFFLRLGSKVTVLVRKYSVAQKIFKNKVEIIECNVENIDIDKIKRVDYIIHAASPANPTAFDIDPIGTIHANVNGTENMLKLAKKYNVPIVFTSSCEIYGENIYNKPLREEDYGIVNCVKPRSCYTESKRLAENLIVSYNKQYGINFLIARIAYCYGGNFSANDNRVVPEFIRMALNKKKITLRSSGAMVRSYIYVADVVESILFLLSKKIYGIFNIANRNSITSIRELAENICKLTCATFEIDAEFQNDDQGVAPFTNGILDSSKLENILPCKMRYNIIDGLKSAVAIFKEHLA